jgi:membrane peptidoglycan carboxypeptidase
MFLLLSLFCGLLAAAMAIPLVALGVGVTNTAVSKMDDIPAQLVTPPQPEKSVAYMLDGDDDDSNNPILVEWYDESREYVELKDIAQVMQDAIIAIEDHRFYQHGALDATGFLRAALSDLAGGEVQGASSLTQQYVKLVRQQIAQEAGDEEAYERASEQTLERKIIELRYAIKLEQELTKAEILERYLNMAFFGDGAYGVESAAKHYFGVSAKDLTLPQAALIAGLVQNPSTTNPVTNDPQKALDRRDVVLNRMSDPDVNFITKEQAAEAKKEPWDPDKVVDFKKGCANSEFPFLCQYVEKVIVDSGDMPGLGATAEERKQTLYRGGLRIQTYINPEQQRKVQAAVSDLVAPTDPVIAAVAIVEPGTGIILGMATNRPEMGASTDADGNFTGKTYYNYAVDGEMGGAEGYQPGSTFKVFTLATALSQGASLKHYYMAPARMEFRGQIFDSCDGPFTQGSWLVKNVGGSGEITLQAATNASVNTYYIQLERDVGLCNVVKMAQAAGVSAAMPGTNGQIDTVNGSTDLIEGWQMDYTPSFTIGSLEISALTEAEAYATFAARGVHCDPIILRSVTDRNGGAIAVPDANCAQTIDPEVADGVSYVLSGGTVRQTISSVWRGGVTGKSGTTDSSKSVWYAGYTPLAAAGAMIAVDPTHPYWKGRTKSVAGLRLTNMYVSGVGGTDAGRIWKAAMMAVMEGKPSAWFDPYTPIKGTFSNRLTPTASPTPSPTPTKTTTKAPTTTTTTLKPSSNR